MRFIWDQVNQWELTWGPFIPTEKLGKDRMKKKEGFHVVSNV